MPLRRVLGFCAVIAVCVLTIHAQEPQPARITSATFTSDEAIPLDFAWRFAPGELPGAQAPSWNDSTWTPIRPQLSGDDSATRAWSGTGWFRRHIDTDASVQDRNIALQFSAPGIADVYLDGRLILSTRASTRPLFPYDRRDGCAIRFAGPRHILAVRYTYPADAPRPAGGFGFRLLLSDPLLLPVSSGSNTLAIAFETAIVLLPLLLALLHLAFFWFDRRARENLFYAAEMIAFSVILLNDFGMALLENDSSRELVNLLVRGGPAMAVLFGLLTYYAIRTDRFPKAWRAFTAAGILVVAVSYVAPRLEQPGWILFFAATLVEIARLELRGRKVRREEASVFLVSFGIFCVTIVMQILINYGLLSSVGGSRQVYLFGVIASAVGMSLYLARRMAHSRVIEIENDRKTRELAQARELQLSMLPRNLPQFARLEIAAATQTAAEVGGDYYDVRTAGEETALFAFGDATGHGLASGIVVTAAKALFNSLSPDHTPSTLLEQCDNAMRAMGLPTFRMCLTLARVTPAEVCVASAAMPPVLVHRAATDAIDEIGDGGLPLGSRLRSRYRERTIALAAGDTLLFASDGFAELLDASDDPLGYDRAATLFRDAAKAASADEVIARLTAAAARHRGTHPQEDDITFVVVRIGGEA